MQLQHEGVIYIIGTGAIGKALATFLKLEDKNVIILRGSIDDQSKYFEKIEVKLNNKTTVQSELEVSTISNFSTLNGIIVITSKSLGNPHLAEVLKTKVSNSPIVILQNGLNVEQSFSNNGFSPIYRCVLFATSQPISQNRFRFKSVGVSPIGIINGDATDLATIVQKLNSDYFEFKAEENIQPVIWTKTIINCVFNSVCPLLEIDNGVFHRNETALRIAKQVITQCLAVAKAKGILLELQRVLDTLLAISKSSDGQLISTYQDIKNKRKTEIETLNFAIANIGKELEMENNVKETLLLGELVQLKSELSQN
jgi:2-dehydropantoate 2-reductase